MGLGSKLRKIAGDVAKVGLVGLPAVQVGGASGGNVAKNVLNRDPLSKNMKGAAALDAAGLAAGFALGPTGIAQNLWGAAPTAGAEGGAAAAPYYEGADAAAYASGINPETGEAMNLGAEELGIGFDAGGPAAADTIGATAGIPVDTAGVAAGGAGAPASGAAAGGNALTRYGPLALGAAGLTQNYLTGRAASKKIGQIGGPQREAGQQLINQYNSGQLTVADSANIAAYEASATAAANQYFDKAGMGSSSSKASSLATIQANVAAMKSQALQNYLKLGTSMLNVTDEYQLAAIQQGIRNDQDMMRLIFGFGQTYGAWNRSLATMTA